MAFDPVTDSQPRTGDPAAGRLVELARIFGRLGLTAFGGPAAHLALFRDEFVRRRAWLTEHRFLDLLGAANLLPGPTSTEVAMSIGYDRAGWRGMLTAGVMFILPASLIVLALAIGYVSLGALPAVGWILYGIQPVVVVLVARAIAGLAPAALESWAGWLIALGALVLGVLGVHPLAVLAAAAGGMVAARGIGTRQLSVLAVVPLASTTATVGLASLFLTFLAIGTVSFGSGYLLLAFLREAFVVPGLLTDSQLLDAVAIGQVTPGPLFTTATFIGYLLAGVPGAVVATVGIFLPSFVLVGLSHPWIARLRESRLLGAALDGVNAAAVGLLVAVLVELARIAFVDAWSVGLAIAALALLWGDRVGPVPVILAGAAAGLVLGWLGLAPP
jgi:chromate transporter